MLVPTFLGVIVDTSNFLFWKKKSLKINYFYNKFQIVRCKMGNLQFTSIQNSKK